MQASQATETPRERRADIKDWLASILGFLIIVAFGAFIVRMLGNLDLEETQWSRAMVLFGGVEAVAFAAAGYFFGTQVQRGRVEEAKTEAKAATAVAERADQSAEVERNLTNVFARGVADAVPKGGLASGDSGANAKLTALAAQAETLLRQRGLR